MLAGIDLVERAMRAIDAASATGRLGHLLDAVEQGEEIVITREGREVARLVPARPPRSRADARAAIARIRARAESRGPARFDWVEWKAFRDEGRR